MKKLKVLTLAGTRPEIIRLSCIIKKFDQYFDHHFVHTGQNSAKELSNVFFKNFDIKPKYNFKIKNQNSVHFVAEVLKKTELLIKQIKPDCFFVLGDTNSALSSIVAKKMQIPIFHYEAGNRCYDDRVPEEINRKIIDTIADVNLTYSNSSKHNLLRENFPPDRVFNVGSPLFEIFEKYKEKILSNDILKKINVKNNQFILVSLHRTENLENKKNFHKIISSINFISQKLKLKIIFSTHPRTKKILKKFQLKKNISLHKPFNFFEYNKLQISAKIVLSDSGSVSEESHILNFPAINIRETHERHEAMEKGVVPMNEFSEVGLYHSIIQTLNNFSLQKKNHIQDYEQVNVSGKILQIVSSYTNYINRKNFYKI
jgi:UDP-N-acetylglucosamine 2-epimerase (non-hydrolysing)